MIYVFAALYAEGKPWIDAFGLKSSTAYRGLQAFTNENMTLVLTGTGMLNAACAVSQVFGTCDIVPDDFLVSYGSAAGIRAAKGLYIANRITAMDTKRSYYPDLLLRHPFKEAHFLTGNQILREEDVTRLKEGLYDVYDMESYAVYHAAKRFMGPHRMVFLRFISDHGEQLGLSELQQKQTETIGPVIDWVKELSEITVVKQKEIDLDIPERFLEEIHASASMRTMFLQDVRYAALCGRDYVGKIREMERSVPVKEKEEGKKLLHEFHEFVENEEI